MATLANLGDVRFLLAALAFHVVTIPVAAAIAPAYSPARWFTASRAEISEYDVDIDSALLPEADQLSPIGPPQHVIGSRLEREQRHRDPNLIPPLDSTSHPDELPDPGEVITAHPDAEGVTDEYMRPPSATELYGPPGLPGEDGNEVWRNFPSVIDDGPDARLPAPTKAPERQYDKKAATKVLQDGVREKEKKLGLDFPGRGPIRSAFVTALYSSDAPYVCEGSFSLSVDKNGKITQVGLLGYSGGTAAVWKAVEANARAALASARLPMKSAFANGALVGVTVRSIERTPAGGTSRDGLKIQFDPSDIGARATRQVTAMVNPQPIP